MRIKQVLAGDRGMTLVEVLVALMVLSFGILTAMTLFANSLQISVDNRDRLTAQNLANGIMEDYKARTSEIKDQAVDFQPEVERITIKNKIFTPDIKIKYVTVNSMPLGQIEVTVFWDSALGGIKSVKRIARISLK